jgi:hypothetical protein
MVWEKWMLNFQTHGFNNIRLQRKFRKTFTLDINIVIDLFTDDEFMKHIKKNRILSKENSFLAFLYKCKTGLQFATLKLSIKCICVSGYRFFDIAEKFGGGESFHSNIFGGMIDRLVYYFKRHIQIPDKETAELHKRILRTYDSLTQSLDMYIFV